MTALPDVKVLMSTFNGESWLREQLESIHKQVNVKIELFIRDDGSTDKTKEILNSLNLSFNDSLDEENNLGPGKSFLKLIKSVKCQDFIALADQDDIWFPDKIYQATQLLAPHRNVPALYCSNVQFSSNNSLNFEISNLPNPTLPLSFFQNSAMGCTIVFNKKAHEILKECSGRGMIMHDWYIFLIIMSTGKVIFDPEPHISYRLHENQFVGWKRKRSAKTIFSLEVLRKVLNQSQSIREEFESKLTPQAREALDKLVSIRSARFMKRAALLSQVDLNFRGNPLEDLWTRVRLLLL